MYILRTGIGPFTEHLSRHDDIPSAVAALDAQQLAFVEQLRANGEGATHASIELDIIEIDDEGNETNVILSRYAPTLTVTKSNDPTR